MKFAEVLEIRNGRNQRRVENENGKYPIYGSGGIIGHADDYICDSETVVIGRKGNINHPIFVEEPFWNVDTAFGLIANKNILIPKYLFYFCLNYDFERLNTTVTIPSLTKLNLMQIDIKVPSMEKQREIVAILDKIVSIILDRQQEVQKLDLFIKSRFLGMFGEPEINPLGWKATTLGNECYYIKDGPHKSLSDIGKGNGGYPFISVRNIVNGYIDFSTAKYISDEDYQSAIKKCHPEKGDILYSKGGTTGIAKLVDVDIRFANWVHLAVLKFDKSILNGVFLENMLNCDYCYMQSQKLTKGIANRDLVLSAIAQIKIYRPPIELQNQFAAFVHQIDKSKYCAQKRYRKNTFYFLQLNKKIHIIDVFMRKSA